MKKMKVGVIGCGAIASIYIHNMKYHFDKVEVWSCSDLFPEKAEAIRAKYDLKKAYTNEEMLADPEVDIIVNLTIPAVHYQINKAILEAGKHLYCEKPLCVTLEEAQEIIALGHKLGLRVASAPDTFLGPGVQTVRKLLDENAIGEVTGFSINVLSPGSELWHPSPAFLFQKGGGPMHDMGPYYLTALTTLLGPAEEVYCYASPSFRPRDVRTEVLQTTEVNTDYRGLLKLKCGVYGSVNASWDIWKTSTNGMEIYGSEGMITVPDPNATAGPVRVFRGREFMNALNEIPRDPFVERMMFMHRNEEKYYQEEPLAFYGGNNMRGVVTVDMAMAIEEGRPHRTPGEIAAHIVDILDCFDQSAAEHRVVKLRTTFERPEAFYPVADGLWLGDQGTISNFV